MTRRSDEAARLSVLFDEAVRAHAAGATGQAERLYTQLLAADPAHPVANYNLALLLVSAGRLKPARSRLQSLLKVRPSDAAAHHMLAKIFQADGALNKSLDHFRRALVLDPTRIDTVLELIETYGRLGRLDEARRLAGSSAGHLPHQAEIATKLALTLLAGGFQDEARGQFEAALRANPGHVLALYNLAKLTDELGDSERALALYRDTLAADPRFEPAAFNAAEIELRLGNVQTAIDSFDDLLARHPADSATLSNRFMAAQYQPGIDAQKLSALHQTWDIRMGAALPPSATEFPLLERDPDRRLRIGFVSPDLCDHPVGYFAIRPLENLDPAAFELVAYADGDKTDDRARRFRRCMPGWNNIVGWSDERLAQEVRRQRIDILFDLSGHTRGNRLPAFARRPAPIQISWAGYVGTTGLSAMDGLIADRFHVPAGEDGAYSEKIIRMADSYICFDPPAQAPEPNAGGTAERSTITFASFHLPAKINAEVADLWARIMRAIPQSRLSFIYTGYEAAGVQARIRDWFGRSGVAGERLLFEGRLPRADVLRRYLGIDIALDTFPYSGGLTTLEALWMGVPVVTMPGATFAARHAFSHLSNAGLGDLIARDGAEYVAIAQRLAADRVRRTALRNTLRQRIAASALCDGPRFAQSLSGALRTLWRAWCAGKGSGTQTR